MSLTTDLQAQIDRLGNDATALKAEVATAVADIATLKGGMTAGDPITQAQIDALSAVGDSLESATAGLKAGE